ncbi:MAG: DUF4105 domain-containing protein, partial [Myxococcota bacterium]|nr:DUF4105 domain-containing protein [Myxococcota bacterium]
MRIPLRPFVLLCSCWCLIATTPVDPAETVDTPEAQSAESEAPAGRTLQDAPFSAIDPDQIAPPPSPRTDPVSPELRQTLHQRLEDLDLATSREWEVLGHYHRGRLGWVSEIDSPAFFLAERGKRDRAAELAATLDALLLEDSPDEKSNPWCRYPARAAWLSQQLDLPSAGIPLRVCPELEAWKERLAVDSVSLVMASAYVKNPASMYGHTMLLFNREERGEGHDLLAYAATFAAQPTTRNPLLYSFMGITGGFPGTFSTTPYYQ